MARVLSEKEKEIYIENRALLHEHLSELQADLEDFNDEDLLEYRECMLKRVNECLKAILETDEDVVIESIKYSGWMGTQTNNVIHDDKYDYDKA